MAPQPKRPSFPRGYRRVNGRETFDGGLDQGLGPGVSETLQRGVGVDSELVWYPYPSPVGIERPSQFVIGLQHLEDLIDSELEAGIINRDQGFDPMIEVARH